MKTRKSILEHAASGCVVLSEHHIYMLSAKYIGEEHLHN